MENLFNKRTVAMETMMKTSKYKTMLPHFLVSLIFFTVVFFLLWLYSRFFIIHTHEFTSFRYHLYSKDNNVVIDLSSRQYDPVFVQIIFVDKFSSSEIESNVLIKEFGPFSVILGYDKDRYCEAFSLSPFMVEFDRRSQIATFSYEDLKFKIIKAGTVIECNGIRIGVRRDKLTKIFFVDKSKPLSIITSER